MRFRWRFPIDVIAWPVLPAFLLAASLAAAQDVLPFRATGALPVAFGADALAAEWSFEQDRSHCTLTQSISDYGRGRFVMGAESVPEFELLALRPHLTAAPIAIESVAPPWHPAYPAQRVLAEALRSDGGDLRLAGDLVTVMLLQLREGYQLRIVQRGDAAVPTDLAVLLSPVRFRAVHAGFSNCGRYLARAQQQALAERAREIEVLRESTVWFETDSAALLPEGRQRLDRVAALLGRIAEEPRDGADSADLQVRAIVIDGHTDSSGSERYNADLSRSRAETVAAHLRQAGIADDRIRIRHHAASRPAASNADSGGRQLNRRTTVRLVTAREDPGDRVPVPQERGAPGDRVPVRQERGAPGDRVSAAEDGIRGRTPERT